MSGLTAGAALDAEVHERVMGIAITCSRGIDCADIPSYSDDMDSAWLVAERLVEKGHMVWVQYSRDGERLHARAWVVRPWMSGPDAEHEADTAPLAICLAALAAVGEGE